jgi:hypothetical protein
MDWGPGFIPDEMPVFNRRTSIMMCLALILAGCAQAATPAIPSGEVDTTEEAALILTDTPTPSVPPTPGPSPTATLPDVPPVTCSGTFAYVMTVNGLGELHVVQACNVSSLSLPDDAGPALDNWVECKADAQPPSLQWSPDGTHLLYVSDFSGAGHGEIHVLSTSTGHVVSLTTGGQVTLVDSSRPHWSPDGSQIAFDATTADHISRHFVMGDDGRNVRALNDQEAAALAQTWAQNAPPAHNPPALNYQVSGPGVTVGCIAWHS